MRRGEQRSGLVVRREPGAQWGGGDRTTEVKVGAGDCTSVAGKFQTCREQDCKNFLRSGNVRAVARDD